MKRYLPIFCPVEMTGQYGSPNWFIMNNYEIIVYWSADDDAFIAEVPELAGCVADGQSYVEAIQNAEIAIGEWIETARIMGRAIPAAHGKLTYA